MGLDFSFHISGSDEPVLEMRHHLEFLDTFDSSMAETVYEGYDDFWVDQGILDAVEIGLAAQAGSSVVSYDEMSADEFEALCFECPDDIPPATLARFYQQAFTILQKAISEHDRLICSWSA
ncbi:hypothetical protein [Loktanella salsilacus]|uniref:hypothetical protein n=1 Tax=Loktanella salsilacus TaxID=195913 RepID=UPI003736F028